MKLLEKIFENDMKIKKKKLEFGWNSLELPIEAWCRGIRSRHIRVQEFP